MTDRYHVPTDYELETCTGYFVNTLFPKADTIKLADIASGLSKTCRYGGQCRGFYSVAEHAVLVSHILAARDASVRLQLAGLHHDDAEAYLGDIPRPFKRLLGPAYTLMTNRMDTAICKALELPFDRRLFHNRDVKAADNYALAYEAWRLLPSQGRKWRAQGHNSAMPPYSGGALRNVDDYEFGKEYWTASIFWRTQHEMLLNRL